MIISTLLLCLLLLLAKFQRLMLQQQAAYYCGNWWWRWWTLIAAVAVVVVVVLRHKIFGELSTATRPTHVQTNKQMALYTKFYMHKYVHIYSIYIYPSKLYICRGGCVRCMHACALFQLIRQSVEKIYERKVVSSDFIYFIVVIVEVVVAVVGFYNTHMDSRYFYFYVRLYACLPCIAQRVCV